MDTFGIGLLNVFLIATFFLVFLIVGEMIAIKTNGRFKKWWRKNVISDDDLEPKG